MTVNVSVIIKHSVKVPVIFDIKKHGTRIYLNSREIC